MPYFVRSSLLDQPPGWRLDVNAMPEMGADALDLQTNHVSLKIWLPKSVMLGVELLATHYQQSEQLIIRNALVIHVYGRVRFDVFVANGMLRAPRGYAGEVLNPKELQILRRSGKVNERFPAADDPLAAAASENLNSIYATRIFMPARLKTDIERLAAACESPVSVYCREALSVYYLGKLAAMPP